MPYKTFVIPVRDPSSSEAELNDFLRSHRILTTERRWVDMGMDSYWCILVDYLEGSPPKGANSASTKRRIDYREVLNEEDFSVFAQLRNLRKTMATEDDVALYNVFTNEQLAQIVQGRVRTKADLQRIDGIGQARIEKYGERLLDFLNTLLKGAKDEASGESTGENRGTG